MSASGPSGHRSDGKARPEGHRQSVVGEVHVHPAHAPSDGHAHHHAHGAGERHPPARLSPSLSRASLPQRLAIALPATGLLWALALWVIGGAGS